MLHWTLERKELPLKVLWKIAGAELTRKETYFVRVDDPGSGISALGEVAPNTRYGSRPEIIRAQFDEFAGAGAPIDWLDTKSPCRALRFGIESAWIHFQARTQNVPVWKFLGLEPPGRVTTSYSLPIMDPRNLAAAIKPLRRFESLKIKVEAESAVETLRVATLVTSQKLRIDGNESFKDVDSVVRFIEALRGKNIEFLEQPMPASMKDEYRALLSRAPFPLIADESIEYAADFAELKKQFSGVNIKLMKAGGYHPALSLLREARAEGMKTMLGCMIETSLGIHSAYQLSSLADYVDLDSFLFLENDPFQLMIEDEGTLHPAP